MDQNRDDGVLNVQGSGESSNPGLRLPRDLQQRLQLARVGPTGVPALLVSAESDEPNPPMVVWLHGRTASKELDPGRYLRLMRSGLSVCALDLPGHGERFDETLQHHDHVLDVILRMEDELDAAVDEAASILEADPARLGIGGMSAGGMVTALRLTRPHPYSCCVLEATTGSWEDQRRRPMFINRSSEELQAIDPLHHLDQWRPIPLLAVHCIADQWVDWIGQCRFLDALDALGDSPDPVQRLLFETTGAPHEHVGFGPHSAEVKERERDFFARYLLGGLS